MSRQRSSDTSNQLSFSLPSKPKSAALDAKSAALDAKSVVLDTKVVVASAVVRFVDAATLATRQDAIRRVRAAGIFDLNHSDTKKR